MRLFFLTKLVILAGSIGKFRLYRNKLHYIGENMLKKAVSMPYPCPNCHRTIIHSLKRKWGCKWCIPIKSTKYCNGKYINYYTTQQVWDREWDKLLKWEGKKFK